MAELTLSEILDMPAFRQGGPIVLAGEKSLDRPIRWVHATELSDIAPLLRAGDLLLSTGIGLPLDEDAAAMAEFARTLAEADCGGLVVELSRRWTDTLPETLIEACAVVDLPLVALTHVTRFAHLTQAVGERLVDAQLAELRDAQRVHDTFTELSFANAGPQEVLDAVQRLAAAPVVVESADHRPLDYLTGGFSGTDATFLDNWSARSARVRISARTGWNPGNGWLVTRLGNQDQTWGRLVIGSPTAPSKRLVAVAERAAAALALHRLHDRDRDNLIRRSHHEIMTGLQREPDSEEWARRADLAGFPLRRRRFAALLIRSDLTGGTVHTTAGARHEAAELVTAVVAAAGGVRLPALVTEADREVRVLLSAATGTDLDATIDKIATDLGDRVADTRDLLVAVGCVVPDAAGIDLTVREARQVADAVPLSDWGRGKAHRLDDTGVRGLLALLGDDERLRLFVDRQLDAIRRHDADRGGRPGTLLLPVLRAYIAHPGSKSDAAAALHLSRPAFYDRLARLERVLGTDLADPDVRASLHVALIADELAEHQT